MNISVNAIKKLMIQELDSHYSSAIQALYNDVQREFIHLAVRQLREQLSNAESQEDLEQYLSDAGYRMSVQEWIDSL